MKANKSNFKFNKASFIKILKSLKYPIYIVLMVCFILGILVALRTILVRNDADNTPVKVTLVESFKNSCDGSKSLKERDNWCKNLNDAPCKYNDCCVLLNGAENNTTCVGGGTSGPTFKDVDYEYYIHKKKCYSKKTKNEIQCP